MPYDVENKQDVKKMKEKLQKTYKNVSDTAARQAIYIWESMMDKYNDESRAWAGVYSKMNERLTKKNKAANTVLFRRLVRLAYDNPGPVRDALLPILREASRD